MRNNETHLREVGDVHCGGLPHAGYVSQLLFHMITEYNTPKHIIASFSLGILRTTDEINQYIINPLREKLRIQNIHKMNQIK